MIARGREGRDAGGTAQRDTDEETDGEREEKESRARARRFLFAFGGDIAAITNNSTLSVNYGCFVRLVCRSRDDYHAPYNRKSEPFPFPFGTPPFSPLPRTFVLIFLRAGDTPPHTHGVMKKETLALNFFVFKATREGGTSVDRNAKNAKGILLSRRIVTMRWCFCSSVIEKNLHRA